MTSEDIHSSDPYISVIIFGYDRKRHIEEAFFSVINQDIDPESFEIIMVTNFETSFLNITEFRKIGFNITDIILEGHIGMFIQEAIRIAKGELVCFLDDDDTFLPMKLKHVRELFLSNPNLGYYSNDYIEIDEESKQVEKAVALYQPYRRRSKSFLINRSSKWEDILNFSKLHGHAFNSTITIRKEIIFSYQSLLRHVLRTEDEVLFCFALDSGRDLLLDDLSLTGYRLSIDGSSHISQYGSIDLQKRCDTLSKELKTILNLLENRSLFYSSHSIKILKLELVRDAMISGAVCTGKTKVASEGLVIELLKMVGTHFDASYMLLVIVYVVSKISRELSRRIYVMFGAR